MFNADLIIGFFSAVFGAVVLLNTRGLSKLGGVFLDYVLVAIFFLAAAMLVKGFVRPEKLHFFESALERNNVLVGVVILMVYLFIMPFIGFLSSSFIFYAIFNSYLSEDKFSTKNILQSLALSFIVVILFYFIFHNFLGVPLPEGSLWED
ncbi:MAG: tripartite tricarboxylate transporter TctB family protein [Desulfatiglandaceae bacterium]